MSPVRIANPKDGIDSCTETVNAVITRLRHESFGDNENADLAIESLQSAAENLREARRFAARL